MIHDVAEGLNFSLGAQPLLFGLKPNGYPGDRSIVGSVEYGVSGTAPVSNQASPSAIGEYKFGGLALRGGVFEGDGADQKVSDNIFLQAKYRAVDNTGLYGVVGVESLDSENIATAGIGYTTATGVFDVSVEYIGLDRLAVEAVGGTAVTDDESYLVTELTYKFSESASAYVDWSNADVADIDALRVGAIFMRSNGLEYKVEYSQDDLVASDVDSLDFRVAFTF